MTKNNKQDEQTVVSNASLLGQYFHSLNADGKVEWQGTVIGNPEPGWYLVQLFEWMAGEANVRRLFKVEDMANWLFYENADAMKYSYEHGVAREGGIYRNR
jgi:hypothetical protein